MNIGELAKRTGLTNSRIRFYESAGLLKTVERRPNGYRTYPPEAVLVLDVITTAQRAGFSLDEIRTLLPPDLEQWNHDALIAALRRKVGDIEALQTRLKQSKAQLVALIKDIEAKPDDIDCATNARRVLSHVLGKEMEKPTMAVADGSFSARQAAGRAKPSRVPNPKLAPSVSGRRRELRIRKDTSKPYDARVVQVRKFAGTPEEPAEG